MICCRHNYQISCHHPSLGLGRHVLFGIFCGSFFDNFFFFLLFQFIWRTLFGMGMNLTRDISIKNFIVGENYCLGFGQLRIGSSKRVLLWRGKYVWFLSLFCSSCLIRNFVIGIKGIYYNKSSLGYQGSTTTIHKWRFIYPFITPTFTPL